MKKVIIAAILVLFVAAQGIGIASPAKKVAKKVSKIVYVNCPVTGEKMDRAKAYSKTVYKGKTYYFCCAMCPGEFKKNPEKYAK